MANPPALEYGTPKLRWYQGLSGYQWWVLCVASMAWLLDTMSQRIFVLARSPALAELMSTTQSDLAVRTYGNYATASMMVGWAIGGFYFGIVGDKWGRAKTLSASILSYSLFTGLSGFSLHWWDFCIYRFLMGCGIGGAFATAATLIAETVPAHSRAFALGMFQALSAVGNIMASAVARWLVLPEAKYFADAASTGTSGWRLMFFLGALPAVLVVFIMSTIKEPASWLEAKEKAKNKLERQLGDIKGMFRHPRWRRNTFIGMSLAVAGVVGLWGVGFWSPELVTVALVPPGTTATPALTKHVGEVKAMGTLLQDVGAFFGMFVFTIMATRFGRRISFGLSFVAAFIVVASVFLFLRQEWQVYVLLPLVGFVTLSVFGGYSIYFPEIYPTSLRASGTSFCYNSARILTAAVLMLGGPLQTLLKSMGVAEPFRWGAVIFCGFYVLGIVALIWAPETKDQPLPAEEPMTPPGGFPTATK